MEGEAGERNTQRWDKQWEKIEKGKEKKNTNEKKIVVM